jgi:hypothetical protein
MFYKSSGKTGKKFWGKTHNSRVARLGFFGTAIDSLLLENNFLEGKE